MSPSATQWNTRTQRIAFHGPPHASPHTPGPECIKFNPPRTRPGNPPTIR
eukprot:m.24376 g.24376  ORF g.24376 m.24376 type:complete len:50 (-) comp6068_c0_seq1:132-281(-)